MRGNNHLRQENADCGVNSRWQMANGQIPKRDRDTDRRLYTIRAKLPLLFSLSIPNLLAFSFTSLLILLA